MNSHARREPIRDNRRLIVPVSHTSYSRTVLLRNGWPRLVIDYGGASLELDVANLWQAEAFGFSLARSSLDFANLCRHLMTESDG